MHSKHNECFYLFSYASRQCRQKTNEKPKDKMPECRAQQSPVNCYCTMVGQQPLDDWTTSQFVGHLPK